MEIYNLMENYVKDAIKTLLKDKEGICKCEQCRMDMICYCLNKIKPRYVISSRGFVHTRNEERKNMQMNIDILSVGEEAINVISHMPRHTQKIKIEDDENKEDQKEIGKSYFFFPVFVGRVVSENFQSITDVKVTLTFAESGEVVKMITHWENPTKLVPAMDGTFSFHSHPLIAEENGEKRKFKFCLTFEKEGYETANKYFEITLISATNSYDADLSTNFFQIEDAILFKED
ncbi:MAG: late competence development ComFB family protein [Spirochaetales bacterium]|nr:late competence development ComFB family protein [Spirochaetales bacterium]